MTRIAVLGAGAFGTALAVTLARDGRNVILWARTPEQAEDMRATRRNESRLPGVSLPDELAITHELGDCRADICLLAVPTQSLSGFLGETAGRLAEMPLVLCCKGIDRTQGVRPSEIANRHYPSQPIAVLTGPSFAEDIARGLPTALTLATASGGADLQAALSTRSLRLYLSDDVVGAELGGALKNVMALAAGLTVGAGLGESARAAVITRGFAEMVRFATSEGARAETLSGLSGLGDLVLTCTSPKSRNFSAGIALGAGGALPSGKTIEGLATAEAVSDLAESRHIDMPLARMVAAVTNGRMSVRDAADALMSRPLKKE